MISHLGYEWNVRETEDGTQVGFWKNKGGSRLWHPTVGRHDVVEADGTIAYRGEWVENALMDEGEESVLNVWLRAQTNPQKFLCLLTSAPAETDTMAVLSTKEVYAPGSNGYSRVEITTGDWGAPALASGDMKSTAAEKTFGPASSANWAALTHVGLVTASTGQLSGSGKFLLFVALSGTTTINIGQSLKYTLSATAS